MTLIDLRSDTVTKPSKAMLEAMMNAQVGDDVFSEDESVNELQMKCAELTGKEAALFVTSGVMGNQLAIKCHTNPGDEVIVESESHVLNYETAAPSVISGVQLLPVRGNSGLLNSQDIKKYVRSKEYYFPVTKLICLENTHNRAGGVILPLDVIREVSVFAKENALRTHLDGARIFNAYAETKISVKEYSDHFDSVSFCFSKGLGCPVGSVLCGDYGFIEMARKWRKILGGGMRQVGFLAASNPRSYWMPSCVMSGQGHMAIGSSTGGTGKRAEKYVAGRFRNNFREYKLQFNENSDSADFKIFLSNTEINTNYKKIFTDNVLGTKKLEREIEVKYDIKFTGKDSTEVIFVQNFNKISKDNIDLDKLEFSEDKRYSFSSSELPEENSVNQILFPAIIITVSAAAIILFFTIRSD